MPLLTPAMNQTAYLKLGIQGFEGSGKTHLACNIAMGLAKLTNNSKVAFYDSEKGSDFWVRKFADEKVQLDVLRSRSFSDLLSVIREAEQGHYSVLIIDSITHVWRDLCDAYLAKKGKDRIALADWGILKPEWAKFTNIFVNSKIHIVMCGRAGDEYDAQETDEGKLETIKTGRTKMKAESETGFEPDVLIETYKVHLADTLRTRTASERRKKKETKGIINRCCVLKDRSDLMNGKIIDQPKFDDFLPIVKFLNLGGEHSGPKSIQSTKDMFEAPNRLWAEMQKLQAIALEQIKEILILAELDGTGAEAKKKRTEKLIEAFGTSSWTAISGMDLETLNAGIGKLASVIEKSMTSQEQAEVIDMKGLG